MDIFIGFIINVVIIAVFALGYKLGQRRQVGTVEELTREQKERIEDLNRQQDELLNYNINKVYGGR